jgi:hypothetical protein
MGDFDISRIVPSTRDLFGALATRRKALALLPICDGDAARLDALDVRAFTHAAIGDAMRQAAVSSSATPSLCVAEASSDELCQRARFFGADGVCVSAAAWSSLSKTAQSMRMMALAHVRDVDAAAAVVELGARALLIEGSLEAALRVGERVPSPTLVVAHVPDADAATLRALAGCVDAATVAAHVHLDPDFSALLAELDS